MALSATGRIANATSKDAAIYNPAFVARDHTMQVGDVARHRRRRRTG